MSSPDQELPDQELPDQELPDQELPDQELPDQELPDQELPDQELPDQELPDQELPDHVLPDQLDPDQMLPFQTPPDQVLALASPAASATVSTGWPKMSCSPVSVDAVLRQVVLAARQLERARCPSRPNTSARCTAPADSRSSIRPSRISPAALQPGS